MVTLSSTPISSRLDQVRVGGDFAVIRLCVGDQVWLSRLGQGNAATDVLSIVSRGPSPNDMRGHAVNCAREPIRRYLAG